MVLSFSPTHVYFSRILCYYTIAESDSDDDPKEEEDSENGSDGGSIGKGHIGRKLSTGEAGKLY